MCGECGENGSGVFPQRFSISEIAKGKVLVGYWRRAVMCLPMKPGDAASRIKTI